MATENCVKCGHLNEKFKFGSPKSLSKAIRTVRENLEQKNIIQAEYWPENTLPIDQGAFSELPESGPWADVFLYFFACRDCGALFEFGAET